jgi:hypothetical protein
VTVPVNKKTLKHFGFGDMIHGDSLGYIEEYHGGMIHGDILGYMTNNIQSIFMAYGFD